MRIGDQAEAREGVSPAPYRRVHLGGFDLHAVRELSAKGRMRSARTSGRLGRGWSER